MTAFLGALLALSTLLLVYPFLIYPLILSLLPRVPPPRPSAHARPAGFVLLFAARDEARDLPDTLRQLRGLHRMWPELEIRAWNDASTDATGPVLDGARDILTVRHAETPVGKAAALARMMEETRADVVLMMDANVRFRPDMVLRFRDHFSDPAVGAVGVRLIPDGGGDSIVGRAYWALEERIKALESRTGSTLGCDGAMWAIRRALYPAFGSGEADDFRPSMEALLRGFRVYSAPDIVVRERAVPDAHSAGRTARIACGAWHVHRRIWPRLRRAPLGLRFRYVSHKLIRWFAGLWLVTGATAALGLALHWGWGPAVLLAVSGGALAAMAGLPPFSSLARICSGFLATTIGVWLAMRGRTIDAWTPVRAR